MKQRGLYLVLACVVFLLASTPVASAAATPTHIQLSVYNFNGRLDWYQAAAEQFMAKNPDIVVEVIDAWYDKLTTLLAGDLAPDLIVYDQPYLPIMASQGWLAPIDSYFAKDFDARGYIPTMFDELRYKGNLFGLPRSVDPIAYRYNRDIFQSRGMADPDATWTWDTLITNGKKLTYDKDGDGIIDQYGFMDFWGNSLHGPVWVYQAGGEIWNKDYTKTLVDSPAVVAGFQMQYDLHHTHNIAPKSDDAKWSKQPWPHYLAGKIAILMAERGRVGAGITTFNYGVAPVAIGPSGKHVTGMTLDFIGMYAKTPHPQEAWRVLKYMVSAEAFAAGREENKEKGIYSLYSPIVSQTMDLVKKEGELGGNWWLVMMQAARSAGDRHPSGKLSICKPNWGEVLNGRSIAEDMRMISENVAIQLQELINTGITW